MSAITAQMVKNLRERTGLPMMECKQALTECDGDAEGSLVWLRKKHKGKMEERSGRETGEGRIGIHIDDDSKVGAIVELQCETAPVAKNDLFAALVQTIAEDVAGGTEEAPDAEVIRKDPKIDSMFTDVYGKLQETMQLRRCRRVDGSYLASYVHHDGKSGVLLALDAKPQADKNVAADLCMHALFTQPKALDRSGMPADAVEKIRVEAIDMAKAEGKPEQIVKKGQSPVTAIGFPDGEVYAFSFKRLIRLAN